jgi:hypothetical protein
VEPLASTLSVSVEGVGSRKTERMGMEYRVLFWLSFGLETARRLTGGGRTIPRGGKSRVS